jgi:hypothetical protein
MADVLATVVHAIRLSAPGEWLNLAQKGHLRASENICIRRRTHYARLDPPLASMSNGQFDALDPSQRFPVNDKVADTVRLTFTPRTVFIAITLSCKYLARRQWPKRWPEWAIYITHWGS